jgi:cold shock protein
LSDWPRSQRESADLAEFADIGPLVRIREKSEISAILDFPNPGAFPLNFPTRVVRRFGHVDSDNTTRSDFFEEAERMAEGTIKKLTDKGFGFIDTGNGKDMFFHMSNLDGVQFDDLEEGQSVSYEPGQGPKGPRAENVRVL